VFLWLLALAAWAFPLLLRGNVMEHMDPMTYRPFIEPGVGRSSTSPLLCHCPARCAVGWSSACHHSPSIGYGLCVIVAAPHPLNCSSSVLPLSEAYTSVPESNPAELVLLLRHERFQ